MSQIDIKEAYLRAYDGTLGTATLDSTPADSDLTFTAKSKHIGSDKISVTLVDPGAPSAALGVVVTDREIVVNLATSTASAITSTAAQVKTAIEASSPANALVTVELETAGAGVVEAIAKTTLDGQKVITIKLGEGNLTYSEHKNRVFTKDRGSLDTVKDDDAEPLDLSLDSTWEWIKADTSATPTLEDVLKQRGEAAAWVSTADDDCQPYCVDIELWNDPGCGSADDEIIMFEEFYYETVDHDLREGTLSLSGRCNREEPTVRRVPAASIDATN